MTRQEAIDTLRLMAAEVEWEYTLEYQAAIDTAIDALRGPVPDPITGLVPCGCGGKAGYLSTQSDYAASVRAFAQCPKCGEKTAEYSAYMYNTDAVMMLKFKVMDAWNLSHGYKEDTAE